MHLNGLGVPVHLDGPSLGPLFSRAASKTKLETKSNSKPKSKSKPCHNLTNTVIISFLYRSRPVTITVPLPYCSSPFHCRS